MRCRALAPGSQDGAQGAVTKGARHPDRGEEPCSPAASLAEGDSWLCPRCAHRTQNRAQHADDDAQHEGQGG